MRWCCSSHAFTAFGASGAGPYSRVLKICATVGPALDVDAEVEEEDPFDVVVVVEPFTLEPFFESVGFLDPPVLSAIGAATTVAMVETKEGGRTRHHSSLPRWQQHLITPVILAFLLTWDGY